MPVRRWYAYAMPAAMRHASAYAIAVGAVLATVLVRRLLDPLIGADTPFVVLFFLPVCCAAWYGGIGPGLAATVLALVLGDRVSMDLGNGVPVQARVVRIAVFLLLGFLITWLLVRRRSDERALLDSDQRYRTLAANVPDGVVVLFDRDRRHLLVEGPEAGALGLRAGQRRGSTGTDRAADEWPAATWTEIAPIYGAALVGERASRQVTVAGRILLVQALPLRDADGSVVGGVLMAQDISARLRLEDQLHHARTMNAVGQLAGGVAHDFNNLLAIIVGRVDRLRADLPAGDPSRDGLESVLSAAQRAAALTRQLLALSRKQVLHARDVDLAALVADALDLVRSLVGPGIAVEWSATGAAWVRVDPGQIEQVIFNLCANARDAMAAGGTVRLELTGVEVGVGGLAALAPGLHAGQAPQPGRYARLVIADSGSGMDGTVRARLFEPFFTTKPAGHGTGLGLPAVLGIVQQSGGFVHVASAPGAGTRVAVHLPAVDAPAAPDGRHVAGATVLVVDDEPSLREVLVELLARDGLRVISAASGEEALALAAAQGSRPRLLITDANMPGMDGDELLRRLRIADPRLRAILLSGSHATATSPAPPDAPGTVRVLKPFDPAELTALVRRLVE